MLVLLALHLAAALGAPALTRWWGRQAFVVLALVPAVAAGWAVSRTAEVRRGDSVTETYPWIPGLALDLALRLDPVSWLMLLLVGGVGALVLVYCARYFPADTPSLGRFAGSFVGFAGAMTGLVIADNLLLLYVFWELTSVFSYLLIGQNPARRATRQAAAQALMVTTLGGLAMLVGFVLLGEHAGTYRWSEIVAGRLPTDGRLATAALLILVGAVTKSAIFPTSFWLPAAMAAPSPVSAYLHAAAMVKAGIYLVALLTPGLAAAAGWRPAVTVLGAVTMLAGGWAALRQVDLKLLLAYGTVSQLGLLVLLVGTGDRAAATAGLALLLAHALFKAALFLVAGVVDRSAGSRDLDRLSGLGRRMPALAVVAGLSAASMAGLPPLLGFVAKEAAVVAVERRLLVLAAVLIGTALTVAYSARFMWGAFADKPGRPATSVRRTGLLLFVPPAVLSVAALALGPLAGPLDTIFAPYTTRFPGPPHPLVLWPGFTLGLGLSVLAVAGGLGIFLFRDRVTPVVGRIRAPIAGAHVYQRATHLLGRLAIEVTGATQRGSVPQYLATILCVLLVVGGVALADAWPWGTRLRPWFDPVQPVVIGVLALAAVLAVWARRRITAMVLVGVTGYGTALMFILYGAPDLALTQFLVETVTIAVFMLVLRRLPANFSARPLRRSRWFRVALGCGVGLLVAGLVLAATGGRRAAPVSDAFPDLAETVGHGRNVVNVVLVDIRAWDTLGEISVLVVVATGVASLIFVHPRAGARPPRAEAPAAEPGERTWLRGGPTVAVRRRYIVLEVVTRLIFHTVVVFSLFLLFRGHNAPGGGFAGGLVAGLALALRYLAGGRHELDEAAPVDAGVVLGAGLLTSVSTGALAMFVGRPVFDATKLSAHLPLIGDTYVVTSLFFDIGVYLVVIGLVLDILRSLGGGIDKQLEATGGHRRGEGATSERTLPPGLTGRVDPGEAAG
ncbi:Na+/H+ antiporter subunit A [Plantactinospora sp. GCM10030261]|uniref:Na+/H+ antiporter subunit A n=1 Tax=Plantactinospora sp. GCM10030261 TaxID=3273420 RepID=UPI0036240637